MQALWHEYFMDRYENKYTTIVKLIDRATRQVFYDKLTLVFIELPRFNKKLDQLKTFFEKWIYIIQNLHSMKEIPDTFRNEVFEKLFEEAKIARMTKEEKDAYNTSLKNLRAMNIARIEINKLKTANAILGKDLATLGKDLASKDQALLSKDQALATLGKALALKDQRIAAQEKELAELRKRFGVN